ncbi:MAG TPA: cytochrome c [Candidatus Acidoferrales bacterium]|nr:cytochrome c [Candidatus Acidoferrales bacterium]
MYRNWLCTTALILGAAGFAWAAPAGDAKAGKAVYQKSCATCHGMNGEGKEAIAKMLHTTMKPLGSKEVQDKSDAELKKAVTGGIGKMQPVKGLSEKQVNDVIAYVRELGRAEKK